MLDLSRYKSRNWETRIPTPGNPLEPKVPRLRTMGSNLWERAVLRNQSTVSFLPMAQNKAIILPPSFHLRRVNHFLCSQIRFHSGPFSKTLRTLLHNNFECWSNKPIALHSILAKLRGRTSAPCAAPLPDSAAALCSTLHSTLWGRRRKSSPPNT